MNEAQLSVDGGYVTIVTTRGPVLAKRWQLDGSIQSYDQALQFYPSERQVTCLDDLAALLIDLSQAPLSAVVRGRFIGSEAAKQLMPDLVRRKTDEGWKSSLQPGAVFRRGELFRDSPCSWIMLDVDGFETGVDPLADPRGACIEFVLRCLPASFHGASFFWSLSGSAGSPKHEGRLKAHLWFWLAEPRTSAQLRAWAVHVPAIDRSMFNPVQLHYTAAPIFQRVGADPVGVRSGLVRGARREAIELALPTDIEEAACRAAGGSNPPMADPGDKQGIVGAFCRIFRPEDLLSLLPDMFERGRDRRHFSWLGHDSPDGVYITACGHGLVNIHASAPSGQGRRRNVFDFVRAHNFGDLDAMVDETVAITLRPSWRAMLKWIEVCAPEVIEEVGAAT